MGIQKNNKMYTYYVYIMASRKNGTLYIGVTDDLLRCVKEHKGDIHYGFTQKYRVHTLVHYEEYHAVELAITREIRLKKWNREWKIALIEENNPE